MFRTVSAPRSTLSPHKALEIASAYLENARHAGDPDYTLMLCFDIDGALSRVTKSARKCLVLSISVEDQTLCNKISAVYFEQGKILNNLGYPDVAQISFRRAEKWKYDPQNPQSSRRRKPSISIFRIRGTVIGKPNKLCPDEKKKAKANLKEVAHIPEDIFPQNVAKPVNRPPHLPGSDERLVNTPQLAYCLEILSKAQSTSRCAAETEEQFGDVERAWIEAKAEEEDEPERLRSLATKLIETFIDDDLKDAATVTEVLYLAPVLEQSRYRKLLGNFIDGIEQSTLLQFELLEGLGQQIQCASPGYLLADDLVRILKVLSSRLRDTHSQSNGHLYQLTRAVSNVLDAMADSSVKGLDREKVHEPLTAYLDGLKGKSDPYLVYHAAYAYQALLYVPNNESPMQSVMRRAGVVISGFSGMASAVKGLDLMGFIEGLQDLQQGLAGVYQVAKVGYEGVTQIMELMDSGRSFLDSLKEGLNFNQKAPWYPALRGTDELLREGRLADFRKLVCEAPCRRDPAFEWGLCQRLGEIAANTIWNANARKYAIDFLGELYKNDVEWDQHATIKQWILTILTQLSDMNAIGTTSKHASTLLQELEKNGSAEKQAVYQTCVNGPRSPYRLKVGVPELPSPSLLDRVQDIPEVEQDLRKLKKRRQEERKSVYIPPQAKPSLQSPDDARFPLMENVQEFLNSDRRVLLLLGESGAGKSTFNRGLELHLWNSYKKKEGTIPLLINLAAIDRPEQDLIAKHLRKNEFSESQIRELKNCRDFILICDGYDESQQSHNLYVNNQLNEPGQWRAKMVISCRTEYLGQDYRDRFQPAVSDYGVESSQLQEAVIAPFTQDQIHDYIRQYVSIIKPIWRAKTYLEALEKVPNLMELIKNPFLLTLSLDVLPRVVDLDQIQDLSKARITRVELYDRFVEHWLERGKKRIGNHDLSPQAKAAFDTLVDEGFTQNGLDFLKRLASAIYRQQAGHPVVEYTRFRDEGTWKSAFFNREEENQILREASPLARSGNQYRFIHRSVLEYCFTLSVFDPKEQKEKSASTSLAPTRRRRGSVSSTFSFDGQSDSEEDPSVVDVVGPQESMVDHPLRWRSFVNEPSVLQFFAERAQQEPLFKQQLLDMIERSKTDKKERKAAANAITILVRAGVRFNGADLKGIRIPGADLTGGEFDSAQLQGADLRKINLRSVWLRQADLSQARMAGVQTGEMPYLVAADEVNCCAFSADGKNFAVALENYKISMYDASTWTKSGDLPAHMRAVTSLAFSGEGLNFVSGGCDNNVRLWAYGTDCPFLEGHTERVMCVAYSPDDKQVASSGFDKTVRFWDAQTGAPGAVLTGHKACVNSLAYSPNGQQLASGCDDGMVHIWDVQTGQCDLIINTLPGKILCLAYSPKGHQIATADSRHTVRLWDAHTGVLGPVLRGHTKEVRCVAYSPNGQQIVSGSSDNTLRLWNAQTGAPGTTLGGHTGPVTSVVYSPDGQYIASGSLDETVRLWDAQTDAYSPILRGHLSPVIKAVVSSSGRQVASCSYDKTVRLWDAQTGASGPILSGHRNWVTSVAYSPNGQQIASGGDDDTVQLWDAKTGAHCSTLTGHTSTVRIIIYSPSGQQIASGSDDGTVRLWNAETLAPGPVLIGHAENIRCMAYSPSGQQIASGSQDYTVRLWDTLSGACCAVLTRHTGYVKGLAYSPNGQQIASGSDDKTVQLWDTQTGEAGLVLSGHTQSIMQVIYSPNGQQIASGSSDSTVRLWDAQTGNHIHTLSGHTGLVCYIECIAYSPCGQLIATSAGDNTVRLWDTSSGKSLAVVRDFYGTVTSIVWNVTPEGTYFGTSCEDKSVRMWQVIEDEGQYQIRLQWSSMHEQFAVSDANLQDTQGLNKMQMKLLEQRGAKGKPKPPLSFREAGAKVINMKSVVSKLKKS